VHILVLLPPCSRLPDHAHTTHHTTHHTTPTLPHSPPALRRHVPCQPGMARSASMGTQRGCGWGCACQVHPVELGQQGPLCAGRAGAGSRRGGSCMQGAATTTTTTTTHTCSMHLLPFILWMTRLGCQEK